jgi:hypothetical protein
VVFHYLCSISNHDFGTSAHSFSSKDARTFQADIAIFKIKRVGLRTLANSGTLTRRFGDCPR